MSAMPVKKIVVAHPSALRNVTHAKPAPGIGNLGAGAQLPARDALGHRLRGDDGIRRRDDEARRREAPSWLRTAIAMATGLALFVALWAFVAKFGRIPDPVAVGREALKIFSDPFYRNGPNDQGIGWNVLTSLGRVGLGFGLAAVVGIPAGFMIGRFRFLSDMAAPIVALLKPVSPLAWLPIGLLLFKAANPASIYVIFVCSLWPMIMNTAAGVRQIPQDYLNVARVLNLSEWKVFTRIL
ncbi:MAG TPA: ABC transporter permease subunit, partial [Usitatibacter sp.]|nr:ABC transporter permease subunit [Usitatibacter sp.]